MPASREANGWRALVITLLVPIVLAAVAIGMLRGNVGENRRDIDQMDERFTEWLVRVEGKLDRALERTP